ncbi:MAG: 30S ribosomal protein S12 methylthiotransferase RimO [Deltaproteobacteria bacterium]|nr:30S ribosomal protein S12 methylthiotransferase RimO [Deltaproteobacteria bacterium]
MNLKPKTVFTVSLGCPKNLVDTEIMLGGLTARGWEIIDDPERASLLLVNTCAFIKPASQEAVDTILALAQHKSADPAKILAVTGCLVQRYGPELPGLLPEVDIFLGVNDFPRLAELLEQKAGIPPKLFAGRQWYGYAAAQPRFPATPPHLAYLKLAEGCSHRCTFCTIPQIRGPYRSRPMAVLLEEAAALAASGVKELILVAQDTTAYGVDWGGGPQLAALLKELARVPGLAWIRLLYGHPAGVTPELLEVMAAHPEICPYLDLPIQHAHDAMLRRMGRGYTRKGLLDTFRLIRQALPHAALRTTVIVGFPGETEEHFETLLDLAAEVRFDHLGIFLYEPEEGTPAARLAGTVPRRTARARARRLKARQGSIVKAKLKSLVGSVQPVLVEGVSQESEYLLMGRLSTQAPDIDGRVYITEGVGRIGEIQPVRLTRALPVDLVGGLVEDRGKIIVNEGDAGLSVISG